MGRAAASQTHSRHAHAAGSVVCVVLGASAAVFPLCFLVSPAVHSAGTGTSLRHSVQLSPAPELQYSKYAESSATTSPSSKSSAIPLMLGMAVGLGAVLTSQKPSQGAPHVARATSIVARRAIVQDDVSEALPFVFLANASGDTAKVFLQGACVASYVKDGNEVLGMRKDSVYEEGKAISGGVPICWPHFGPAMDALPQHGFARIMSWTVAEVKDGREPSVVLRLVDNNETRKMWDHAFEAFYTVILKATGLETSLHVKNTGASSFDFTSALHSYWNVSDAAKVKISGEFDGKQYLKKFESDAEPWTETVQEGDELAIASYMQRLHKDHVGGVTLHDADKKSAVTIKNTGWSDLVLWNPWGNDKMGAQQFVGIEPAQTEPVLLAPNAEWVAKMEVSPVAL